MTPTFGTLFWNALAAQLVPQIGKLLLEIRRFLPRIVRFQTWKASSEEHWVNTHISFRNVVQLRLWIFWSCVCVFQSCVCNDKAEQQWKGFWRVLYMHSHAHTYTHTLHTCCSCKWYFLSSLMRAFFSSAVFCWKRSVAAEGSLPLWDSGLWGKLLLEKEKSESGMAEVLSIGQARYSVGDMHLCKVVQQLIFLFFLWKQICA